MTYPKRSWIIAGAAAAFLGSPALARAATGEEYGGNTGGAGEAPVRKVEVTVDGKNAESGKVDADKGEPVLLVFSRSGGPEKEDVVLPVQGLVAELPLGEPIAVSVISLQGGIAYSVLPENGNGSEAWDAMRIEAGDTGGRG
jgi:hypothetical protein